MHEINQQHYDQITNPWQFILGDNFHWGYFSTQGESLEEATNNLIDEMSGLGTIDAATSVLDIGCGIGTPARYLHRKYGCQVKGLSNSAAGVKKANAISEEEGLQAKVSFVKKDALSNGFPDGSFDVAWLMEMSHLIEDKQALIQECYRSLKKGGTCLLCDLTLIKPLTAKEIFTMSQELRLLENSFGKASLITLDQYQELFLKAGFAEVQLVDISQEVIPTLEAWRQNLVENKPKILESFSAGDFDNFVKSCDILEDLYQGSRWGYGIVVAKKN